MVFGKEERASPIAELGEMSVQQPAREQLLLDPHRHRGDEAAQPERRKGVVGLEQAFEFQERLVVESDRIQILEPHPRFLEDVLARVRGKGRVVPHSAEALFLSGGYEAAVDEECGGAVVVVRGDAENGRTHAVESLLKTACR
jgi:hypothetical protein